MLKSVQLQHYRSYTNSSFQFDPGVNAIIGLNGSGKTNLLEAIMLLHDGSSFRSGDVDLINTASDWTRLDGECDHQKRIIKIKRIDKKTEKVFEIDNKPKKRLLKTDILPAILFEPNHLQLLIRGPDYRRTFLDESVSRLVAPHKAQLATYLRILAQRNALLKNETLQPDQLFIWNLKLAEAATNLIANRLSIIETINQQLSDTYSSLAHTSSRCELRYESKLRLSDYSNQLLRGLEQTIHQDRLRGFTSLGPHRDDLSLWLNDKDAAHSASRGEVRSMVLGIKITELNLLRARFESEPIVLLDDVFSELDEVRQQALVSYFKDSQVILTTTSINALIRGVSGKIIEL